MKVVGRDGPEAVTKVEVGTDGIKRLFVRVDFNHRADVWVEVRIDEAELLAMLANHDHTIHAEGQPWLRPKAD